MEIIKEIITQNKNKVQLFAAEPFLRFNKTILFIGVTHGEEPQGEHLINNLIRYSEFVSASSQNRLLFIPCLNPDGRDGGTRGNSNGVDLNRNFPTKNWALTDQNQYFGGEKPASEVETRFLVEVLKEYNPDVIFSIHAPFRVVNYDGPAEEIAKKVSELCGYPVQEDIGYPTPGSFGTYAGIERNIATITLELPEDVDDETLWQENKDALFYVATL